MVRQGVVVVVLGLSLLGCEPVQKPDPCEGVSCGEGRCAVVGETAACLCNQGSVSVGLRCTAIAPTDLCASNPCANLTNSLCQVNSGQVSCVCPATRVEVNGSCVLRTACLPNPCQNAHRTTCEVSGGVSSCRCDPGFAPEGDGCAASPVWTCATQHVDGDAAEADECPTFAKGLNIDVEEQRTIFPAGDHDWFELGVTPGHLFSISANSTSLPLLIDVFDSTGVTLLASDNRGSASAEVTFVAPLNQNVMVRVRGVRASETGGYFVRYRTLGVDDYANTEADAITLVPGANPFAGSLQYAGDLDVIRLEMPSSTAIRFTVADAGADLQIEVARPDGGVRRLNPGEITSITTPGLELLTVTARARNPRSQGEFSLSFDDLGVDDHSDEAAFGTPIASNNLPVPGRFERQQDIDCFSVAQLPDRIYRARWVGTNFNPVVSVVLPGGQVLTSNGYSTTGLVWQATQALPAAVRLQNGYSSSLPMYSVAVEDLGLDDHSNTLNNATPLTAGVPVGGRLELLDDVDTFSFTGAVGRIIQVTAAPTAGTQANQVIHLSVINAQGVVMAEGDSTVGMQIAATGLYKVQVERGGYSYATDLVGYTLTVTDQGVDDHAGTSIGATALTPGTPVSGNVQYAADIDAFAFTGLANHVYQVNCARSSGTCNVTVKDAVGQVVANSNSTVPTFLAITGQRFVVEVNSGYSYSTQLGLYSLTVLDLGLEDHGGTISNATPITVGTAMTGNLAFANDIDAFSFAAVAGNIYAATLTPAGNTRVEVRDSSNNLVASSNYNAVVSFRATTSGSYFVLISSYSSNSPYSLTVTDRGVDDHSNTATGATALTLGTSTGGELQYQGDVDFFSVPVVAGHHHLVACTGSNSCSVTVQTTTGTTISSSYSSSGIAFKPPAGATVVNLQISSSYSSDVFRYQVVVTDLGADDHGDARADATALSLGAAATAGVIETSSDVDAFTITAGAGDIISLDCVVTSGSACVMTITSPSGSAIASTSSAVSSLTGFLASSAGSYLVTVRSNAYSSGNTGAYTLAATRGSDDFTSTTPFTRGTPRTGSIDYVGDTDVFSVVLTQGVAVQMQVSSGTRAQVTGPNGNYVTNLYGGYATPYVPTITGTYLFTVSSDSYYGNLSSYTLTVQ
ncbi:MAG: hypothetical protein Q8K32_08320 [Archangium sp.]|nr:hypothetical protein [Archangium sp.]